MNTINNLMALHDEAANDLANGTIKKWKQSRTALRAALTEALAQPAQPDVQNCISEPVTNCRHCGGDSMTLCGGQCKARAATIQESLKVHASAEDYLRYKFGAYRGHFAWRDIEEGYTQGRYDEKMAQGPNQWPESMEDFEIRGKLAEGLQCWHRLTGAEAENLVSFFANHVRAAHPAREAEFMEEVAYEHVFADGSKSLSYGLSFAGFPPRTDADHVNLLYTTPQPAREPLSEVQIEKIFATCHAGRMYPQDNFSGPRAMRITETRAIERAHGIGGDK